MSKYLCERIIILKGRPVACNSSAFWITPPGPYTGRVINVCSHHKQKLIDKLKYTKGEFQKL